MSKMPEIKKSTSEDRNLLSDEQLESVDGGFRPFDQIICSISFTGYCLPIHLPVLIPGEIKPSRFASDV